MPIALVGSEFLVNSTTANDKTIVEGDVNGDGKADFEIEVHGSTFLTSDDFLG